MLSCMSEKPGPEVAVSALVPASEAPITAPIEAISSSIWMKWPPTCGQAPREHLGDLGRGRDRVAGEEARAGGDGALGDRFVALDQAARLGHSVVPLAAVGLGTHLAALTQGLSDGSGRAHVDASGCGRARHIFVVDRDGKIGAMPLAGEADRAIGWSGDYGIAELIDCEDIARADRAADAARLAEAEIDGDGLGRAVAVLLGFWLSSNCMLLRYLRWERSPVWQTDRRERHELARVTQDEVGRLAHEPAMGRSMSISPAAAMASGYPASAWRKTPMPGSLVSTRSRRSAAARCRRRR